jgi:hypothetical protein
MCCAPFFTETVFVGSEPAIAMLHGMARQFNPAAHGA